MKIVAKCKKIPTELPTLQVRFPLIRYKERHENDFQKRITNALLTYVLLREKNSGRQCHFKIWLDCHK
jgi:hypothetical protein